MIEKAFILVLCHLIGDYVLQDDYLAQHKGRNWYVLFAHCVIYLVPFYCFFGFVWQLIPVFVLHFIVDALKARYKKIGIVIDQTIHYATLGLYFI